MARNASHTVFVGNIPYDVTEQELTDIFSEVGPIKSMRMVSDKDTGKPKGYAFCEFFDRSTAESAVRNLNQHEVSGRNLRVDYAEDHPGGGGGPGGGPGGRGDRFFERDGPKDRGGRFDRDGPRGPYGPPAGLRPLGAGSAASAAQAMASILNSPQVVNGPAQDTLNHVLGSMNPIQLFEVMSQMKTLAQQNPAAARQVLVSQPQLTRALFQAQILLGMVKPQARPAQAQGPQQGMAPGPAGPMVAAQPGPPQQFQPVQPGFLPGQQPAAAVLPAGQPQVVVLGPGGVILDQSVLQQQPQQSLPVQAPVAIVAPQQPIAQPPVPQQPPVMPVAQQPMMAMPQPAPQAAALQPAAAAPLSQDQQQALLNQLLRLTPEQLEALPPVEKAQARAIINMIKQQQGGQ